jgi:hypothetical protein
MALAKKMFIPWGTQVPCVNLVADVELDDIHPWAASFDSAAKMVLDGKAPSMFVFVETSSQLNKALPKLSKFWAQRITFWVFYPKAPHLMTDLSRDKTWELMAKAGMKGTRQVGIDSLWSCLYFKNS